MKKIIILLVLTTILLNSFSQKMPLRGSGKTVNQTFQLDGFYKINLLDLDGAVEVTVGKEFSLNAIIDDNLAPLLDVSVDNGTLTVQLKGNLYNKLYIEETNIKIKITLPEVSVIKHRSNGKLIVDGISGRYFGIINAGNGSAYIIGSVNELNITCTSNGSVFAQKVKATKVNVKRRGNGNVYTE